ncbi:MAG: hypothetical protein IJ428_01870 [Clostridia bacterium]|nr:hypothetical protein [Clostridia bacterium]
MPNMPSHGSRNMTVQYQSKPISGTYNRRPVSAAQAQPQGRDPSRVTVERIKPLNPTQARARVAQISQSTQTPVKSRQKDREQKRTRNRTRLWDFLLGFTVGLVIFGIAAIIVCSVLINMFI